MKLGCGYPMGPFTLLDFVGLDTTYYITHVMYDEFKERRFASPPLLKRMVMAGWYGRKSGRGFYDYADPKKPGRRSFRNSTTEARRHGRTFRNTGSLRDSMRPWCVADLWIPKGIYELSKTYFSKRKTRLPTSPSTGRRCSMRSTWRPWRSCGRRFMTSRTTRRFASSSLPERARRRLLPGPTLANWRSTMRFPARSTRIAGSRC